MKIGQMVKMTSGAIENYGVEYVGKVFRITAVADKYMPAKEFYAKGRPNGYHPGYDEEAGGNLYDLSLDGDDFGNSLYYWEIERD